MAGPETCYRERSRRVRALDLPERWRGYDPGGQHLPKPGDARKPEGSVPVGAPGSAVLVTPAVRSSRKAHCRHTTLFRRKHQMTLGRHTLRRLQVLAILETRDRRFLIGHGGSDEHIRFRFQLYINPSQQRHHRLQTDWHAVRLRLRRERNFVHSNAHSGSLRRSSANDRRMSRALGRTPGRDQRRMHHAGGLSIRTIEQARRNSPYGNLEPAAKNGCWG